MKNRGRTTVLAPIDIRWLPCMASCMPGPEVHSRLARARAGLRFAFDLARARFRPSRALREEAKTLELLNRVNSVIAAELDLEQAVQVVTDTATTLSGAAFGSFFYNVIDEHGEAYTLYTISGVSRDAFAQFPMPRNTKVFAPTFRGEGIVRSHDITQDPRYGKNAPYHGMPKGHLPVRSYLAVSVVSRSGEVIGGLFFGHPQPGVFGEHAERIVAAIAVQAGLAIDKARLYRAAQDEIRRRIAVEAALRQSEETLEAKVAERTAELESSNARLLAEAQQREKAEGSFRLLVDNLGDYAMYMLDPDGVITTWNSGAERIKGYTGEEIIGQHFSRFFLEGDRVANAPALALQTAARDGRYEAELQRVRKDGSTYWGNVIIQAIRDEAGELRGFAKITRDITERRQAAHAIAQMHEQLVQAQKMEGIGHLTGGIAHDFNNLLAIIMGNIESMQRALQENRPDPDRLKRSSDQAMRGVQRAVALTERLLAFSRQQPLNPKVLSISRLVTGMADLLLRSLGEQVVVETVLSGALWPVHVDATQLEVAILNLALNARDAMPEGGSLTIETTNTELDGAYAAMNADVASGQYVAISISDTGSGMSPEVATRAFEPFFTTKDVGHGTGLGLSQVYGFVKQSGGHVKIYSEEGEGTTIKIYLPRWHTPEEQDEESAQPVVPQRSASLETVLVVEDEPDVRAHSVEMLQELGYRTLEAGTGAAGLQLLDENPQTQLLFTDVGLPGGMNGRQLADEARRRHPHLRVLFTTGYARNAIVHHGRLDPGVQLITKPFTFVSLAAKVREVLDARESPPRLLFVDDEPMLHAAVGELLNGAGYRVEAAETATEAIRKLRAFKGDIDAAIIDIGLPDRGGDTLFREVRAVHQDLPIVIASGSDVQSLRQAFQPFKHLVVVGKPYTLEHLLGALESLQVRPVLGSAVDSGNGR